MTDFVKLRDDLKALEVAVLNGDVPEILRTSGVVLNDAGDVASLFLGVQGGKTHSHHQKAASECVECCERIEKALPAVLTRVAARSAPSNEAGQRVGALGDGTILRLLFNSLPQILAIIQMLSKKAQPTSPTA
jgi:hypothetical protein